MDKKDRIKYNKLLHRLGLKYKLTDKQIKELVESPYEFAQQKIKEIDLEGERTIEEVNNMKTNFNFLAFGKLYFSPKLVYRKFNKNNKK